jgi:hypothetical protein
MLGIDVGYWGFSAGEVEVKGLICSVQECLGHRRTRQFRGTLLFYVSPCEATGIRK